MSNKDSDIETDLEVPDHLFFLAEDPAGTVHAVEVFPVAKILAVR